MANLRQPWAIWFLDFQAILSYIARPWLKKQAVRQTAKQTDKDPEISFFFISIVFY